MKENYEIHWKDYYEILQVQPLAEPVVIKATYEGLAKKYHPDRNPGNEAWANEKFKDIIEAFEILGNPQKRIQYDRTKPPAYQLGYDAAKKEYAIWYFCNVCQKRIDVTPNSAAHNDIIAHMKQQGWGHKSCHE